MPLEKSNGLKSLLVYSSGEEETKCEETPRKKLRIRLPLPEGLVKENTGETTGDDPKKHDGRIRSFPHERGNWATYIYIPYEHNGGFELLLDAIVHLYNSLEMQRVRNPHISLTKTFVLLHHWIDHLMKSLKEELRIFPSFILEFDSMSIYVNEEKTRTFISFDVNFGKKELGESLSILGGCLKDYRLEPFYEDPCFHMSIAWCLGNKKAEIEARFNELRAIFEEHRRLSADSFLVSVDAYFSKSGHREYKFDLAPT